MTIATWLSTIVAGMARRLGVRSVDATAAPTKTVDELLRAGTPVSSEELARACQVERSQLSPLTRFPQWGDVFEPLHEVEVSYPTSWRAPYTGGGTTRLYPGDQVVVSDTSVESQPLGVYADAVNYSTLEARVVPESDRQVPEYDGFYFHLRTSELNRDWHLVRERPQWPHRDGSGPRR